MVRFSVIVFTACVLGPVTRQAIADPPPGGVGREEPRHPSRVPPGTGRPVHLAAGDRQAGAASEAEQIAQLERAIATDQEQLAQLQTALGDPRQEYAKAEAEFERIDTQLKQKQKVLQALQSDGKSDRARFLQAEIASFQPTWKLAKERFELEIEERKALRSEIATLQRKIEHDRQALSRLTDAAANGVPSSPTPPPVAAAAAAPPPATPVQAPAPPPQAVAPTPSSTAAGPSAVARPGVPAAPTDPTKPISRELSKAIQDEKAENAAVHDAEEKAQSIAERIGDLDEDIALEQKLLGMAQKKADNAHEAQAALAEPLRTRSVAGAPPEELRALAQNARDAEQRAVAARAEVRQHSARLDELQSERAGLLAQQVAARDKARAEERRLAEVQGRVRQLENPFAPRNVLHWLIDHGPKMLAIALAMLIFTWLAHFFSHRIVSLVARGGFRGSKEEREARAHTLVGVFHNAATVLIVAGGILMLLQEAGIPIAPLLGGAAVFGLAVAFGAQNLIRDYFYGFVILLENQYKINDVVKIGTLSGSVERITLRMTVLRDLEGAVHFLPNGGISSVTNMTHGWSRAVFEVSVAYTEDIDRVMGCLVELGREMRADSAYASMILDDLTMLGVDALADSAVTLKFFIKTRPVQQWAVKRELLRRIKNRFDALGIEIPLPQRVVYHRLEDGVANPLSLSPSPSPSAGSPPPPYRSGLTPDIRPETRSQRR